MLKTVIRENDWLKRKIEGFPFYKMDFGWGNGYALIPIGHKFHGQHYDTINEFVSVHGDLTYSKLITREAAEFWKLDEGDIGTWCVGFDTCHFEDTLQHWSKEKVQREADRLAQQLEKYS